MCSKLIFCLLEAQNIAPKTRSCPKVADHNRGRPIYPQASIPESGFTYMRRSLNLSLLVEIDAVYFKRDKCVKKQQTNKQTNKQAKQNNNNNKNIAACQWRIQTFRWGAGGGGGGGHPDPEIRRGAVSKNFFFALRASIRGESKRGKSSFSVAFLSKM